MDWKDVQLRLRQLDLYDSGIDGIPGSGTIRGTMAALDKLADFLPRQSGATKPAVGVSPPRSLPATIPLGWMPKTSLKMKRVIVHWTAGTNKVSELDKEHYHFIFDGGGAVVRGDHSVSDNESTTDNDYAAHTRNCNAGSIGVALAGMAGATPHPFEAGRYPINAEQWSQMIKGVAELCIAYAIEPQVDTVLTHAEVQSNLGIRQNGKWDIAVLPFDPTCNSAALVGNRMRREVTNAISMRKIMELPH